MVLMEALQVEFKFISGKTVTCSLKIGGAKSEQLAISDTIAFKIVPYFVLVLLLVD